MEPEDSFQHSQVSAIFLYPEPARSIPYPQITLPEDPSYYYSPIYASVSLIPSGFHTKTLCMPLLSHMCYMPCPSHSPRFDHTNNTACGVQITKLLLMLFPPFSCYFNTLRPKYSPQHPILKSPQSTFLPQCERPSFTPILKNRQNYDCVCLNLYIFG